MSDHLSDDISENTQAPLNNEGDAAGPVAKTFLRIASLGMRSVATSYRLKPGDVIVCLEGEFFSVMPKTLKLLSIRKIISIACLLSFVRDFSLKFL